MQRSDRDKLIEDNINLVYFVINKYYPTYMFDEDIIQTGMVGLCNAVDKYDEKKGMFSTYAAISIQNEIRREFRNRQKEDNLKAISLDVPITDGEGGEISTLLDNVIGQDNIDFVDIDGYYNTLNDREKKYFDLLKEGYSRQDIQDMEKISRQAVQQRIRNMKLKWRKYYGN